MLNREKGFALVLVALGAVALIWCLVTWSRPERWGEAITTEAPPPPPTTSVEFFRPPLEEIERPQIDSFFSWVAGARRPPVKPADAPRPLTLDWPPLPPTESGPPPPTVLAP